MSRINWKPNDRLVCNFFPNLSKWLDLDLRGYLKLSKIFSKIKVGCVFPIVVVLYSAPCGIRTNSPSGRRTPLYHLVERTPKTNFEKKWQRFEKLFSTYFNKNVLVSSLEIFLRNLQKSWSLQNASEEKRLDWEFFRNLDGWIWSQKMCSTSEILNDSKEPRRRRFDEKHFWLRKYRLQKSRF